MTGKIPFRTAYGKYEHTGITFPEGSSLTKQAPAQECDVNSVMARFEKTGLIDHATRNSPQYGDFGEVPDYHEAMNIVLEAEAQFMALPAKVRKRFDNEPGAFLAFMGNPENEDEMRQLGLLPEKIEPIEKNEETPPAVSDKVDPGGSTETA